MDNYELEALALALIQRELDERKSRSSDDATPNEE